MITQPKICERCLSPLPDNSLQNLCDQCIQDLERFSARVESLDEIPLPDFFDPEFFKEDLEHFANAFEKKSE